MLLRFFYILLLSTALGSLASLHAQNKGSFSVDYALPRDVVIDTIEVSSSSEAIDDKYVVLLSGLRTGQKISLPGEETSRALKKLWNEKVFADIKLLARETRPGHVALTLQVKERPRLLKPIITGIKKGERDDITDLIKWYRGEVLTEYLMKVTEYRIKDYLADKGFLNPTIDFSTSTDSTMPPNFVNLQIDVQRGQKVKVAGIDIQGNHMMPTSKIRKALKEAIVEKSRIDMHKDFLRFLGGKPKFSKVDSVVLSDGFFKATAEYLRNANRINIFTKSQYNEYEWEMARDQVIALYNSKGYRDARFLHDTVYMKDNEIFAEFLIEEGNQYFFRDISWSGNQKYTSGMLDTLLGIEKGDVYNQERLQKRLNMDPDALDISSLYQNDGYLYFQIQPVEMLVEGDSIDLEIRISEGKQAYIRRIILTGNTKTNDRVILREVRSKPGDLFRRSDVIRTQQALSQLGIINPQTLEIRPIPDPVSGNVDLEIIMEEQPSDQIELSGGWGAGQVVGTLGLSFRNFSLRNLLRPSTWSPLPNGDGQTLSIRGQSTGPQFQAYNFNFNEPYLGGYKPISLGFFVNHSSFAFGLTDSSSRLSTTSVGVTVGKQLRWPDDYFQIMGGITYMRYDARDYQLISGSADRFSGVSNNININVGLVRNSTNDMIFPTSGSEFRLNAQLTPPWSLFNNKDYNTISDEERFEFLEYHKWKFQGKWFIPLDKRAGDRDAKLVLMLRTEFGFLGQYNAAVGITPFERFFLGGDGLTGFNVDGREIIAQRGYPNLSLTPGSNGTSTGAVGGTIYNKHTAELRFLLSPNPQAKIWVHAFAEAGNAWLTFDEYTPFQINRAVGIGARFFLPMFGLLGVDYGWGLDPIGPAREIPGGQFHFMIGQQF
jgi:outer membrane protein insertion porin family